MVDASLCIKAPFTFYGLKSSVVIQRENTALMTIDSFKGSCEVKEYTDEEQAQVKKQALLIKELYGVCGYIKVGQQQYLILIEKASMIGQILNQTVFKVDKLMYVPVSTHNQYPIKHDFQC